MTGRAGVSETSGVLGLRLSADPSRTVVALVLVGAAYYLGARLGLNLSLVEHNVTPLWPPTGIALAAFLLLGRSMWPGVALAALVVNLPISTGPLPALVTAVGNTLAPLVAAIILERVGFRRQLDRQRDALAIVFLGALASMTISATVGATTLVASGAIGADELAGAWVVWWTGDAMGILAVAPFLLCIPLFWELEPWPAAPLARSRSDPRGDHGARLVDGVLRPAPPVRGAAGAGLGFLASPTARSRTCRADRLTGRNMVGDPRARPVRAGVAVRADAHPSGVQRQRRTHVVLPRGARDRAHALGSGAGCRGRRPGAARRASYGGAFGSEHSPAPGDPRAVRGTGAAGPGGGTIPARAPDRRDAATQPAPGPHP